MQTAKRKRAAKTAIIALVLGALVLIVVVKQFPQKATALLPDSFSVSSCRVTRMSSDKAEDSPLTKAQQEELLEKLEETQMVRRGSSPDKIGPYDKYVYTLSFEGAQTTEEPVFYECKIDDRGKLYTQQGGWSIIGDSSKLLTFLDSLF
ncbi:MAG: hypothetical protein Q3X94_02960 [Oscillospiraceae bacterium]|nr:hypothetical protein [Oscillospiraceae bacterium]